MSGLTATAQVAIENVTCPTDAMSIENCSFVAPPQTLQCASAASSAAGVRCVEGVRNNTMHNMLGVYFKFVYTIIQNGYSVSARVNFHL